MAETVDFNRTPDLTTWAAHDTDICDATPVKSPPYRLSPFREKSVKEEIKYMFNHNLDKHKYSEYSIPVTLQLKPDGEVRFSLDFRKIDSLSRIDAYLLPLVHDSVDKIGVATFITKICLVKMYFHFPLTKSAKQVASFVGNGVVCQCLVMSYLGYVVGPGRVSSPAAIILNVAYTLS